VVKNAKNWNNSHSSGVAAANNCRNLRMDEGRRRVVGIVAAIDPPVSFFTDGEDAVNEIDVIPAGVHDLLLAY